MPGMSSPDEETECLNPRCRKISQHAERCSRKTHKRLSLYFCCASCQDYWNYHREKIEEELREESAE